MKDDRGLYYNPFPVNKKVRMYVREINHDIEFRLWNKEDPVLWMEHGWVPWEAIKQATAMFDKKNFDPGHAYDIEVAKRLLLDEE